MSEHDEQDVAETAPADVAPEEEQQAVATEDLDEVEATQDVGAGVGVPTPGLPVLGLVAIVLGAIALTLGLFQNLASVIAPMFLAINLLIAAYPIYTVLTRVKVPRIIAAVVTALTVFIVLLLGIAAIVWSLTEMVQALTQYSDQFVQIYEASIEWLAQFGFDQKAMLDSLKSISPSSVIDFAGGILSSTSAASGIIAVMVVGIVFMTMDLPSVTQRLDITNRLHPQFTQSIASVVNGIRRYWLITTLFGLIVALLNGGVILLLGVSLPLVWVVLTFITNYIPNIGFVIGLVPPALMALVEKGPVTALIVVISFSVLNFIIQSLIQPKFTGDAVGITPTVSFVSLLLWAWVFGPLGALIALPSTLTVKALLIDSDPRLRWVNAFISNDPKRVADPD